LKLGWMSPAALLALATLGGDLAAQPRARQGLVSLDDARLFYEVVGEGDPVIVVHGGPGLDHEYLQPGLDALATRHTLVYYDQRGSGRSVASLDETGIRFDAFVEDIDALRQALGFERVTLLTHSFGALFAERAARQAAAQTAEDAAELARLTGGEGFAARDPATVSQVFRVRFRQAFRDRERIGELDLDLAESTAENGAEVERLLGASMGELDWWSRLPSIRVPTLVLHGRHDVLPLTMSQDLARSLPVGRLAVLDSGHFPYVEDPEGMVSAISSFLVDLTR
jgi:proline iminopeptidase